MTLKKLSKEQASLLPVYRDRWLKIGLSTEPCDRAAAEASAIAAYKVAGLAPPSRFIWFGSPLSLVLGDAIIKDSVRASVRASVRDSVRASVGDSVRDSVRASVGDSVWDLVWDSVGASVRDLVWDSVGASVRDLVWDSVGASVGASVRDSVRDSVWDSVGDSAYGNQDAYWLGTFEYFLEVCGVAGYQQLRPLMELAKNCGWWIPRKNICLMSEKPVACRLRDGVIHAEDRPAVVYKDGFSVWAIEGVRVDEQIVMRPETQSIEQIQSERNEEVRRIRISRYGWHKYLGEINATVLDSHLTSAGWMEALMQGDNLTVLCTYDPSTGRPYALEVDPSCQTCGQAQRYLLAPEIAFHGLGVDVENVKTYPVLRT